jgi:myo-inositol-1(or 4)-monophosphatase
MSKISQFTAEIAVGAGKILLKYFSKSHKIEEKPGAGIVTEADKASEDYLLKQIFRKFPKSSIITEESGEHAGDRDFCWVMDPLDGTTNYAHRFPWFAVSIGLLVEGQPQVGVIYQPVTKDLFVAERKKGSFRNGKRLRVSRCTELSKALLGTGFYYSKGEQFQQELEIFSRMNEVARGVRRPGSAALDLAYVAAGIYDGFWERGLSAWDVAAGFLLVEEAGGKISNYSGGKTSIFAKECIASNGGLHRRMIEVIRP